MILNFILMLYNPIHKHDSLLHIELLQVAQALLKILLIKRKWHISVAHMSVDTVLTVEIIREITVVRYFGFTMDSTGFVVCGLNSEARF